MVKVAAENIPTLRLITCNYPEKNQVTRTSMFPLILHIKGDQAREFRPRVSFTIKNYLGGDLRTRRKNLFL
jgi:hypothetical protein